MRRDVAVCARGKKVAIGAVIILCAVAAGVAVLLWTPFRIPCPFYELTGMQCPFCGGTRMTLSLLQFDFMAAFSYNPYLFMAIPALLLFAGAWVGRYIRTGRSRLAVWQKVFLIALIAAGIVFAILRNL